MDSNPNLWQIGGVNIGWVPGPICGVKISMWTTCLKLQHHSMGNYQDPQTGGIYRLYISWELVEAPCSLKDIMKTRPSSFCPIQKHSLYFPEDKGILRFLWMTSDVYKGIYIHWKKALWELPRILESYLPTNPTGSNKATCILDIRVHVCSFEHTHSFSSHKTVCCSELQIPKSQQGYLDLKSAASAYTVLMSNKQSSIFKISWPTLSETIGVMVNRDGKSSCDSSSRP